MPVNIQEYLVPTNIKEVLHILSRKKITLYAGGTDFMPKYQSQIANIAPSIVNLRQIEELKNISTAKDEVTLGALTTITEILENPQLKKMAPILTDTADCFASQQIRNSATIGGNIANASPSGDMIIPLLVLEAKIELASLKDGEISYRTMPLSEFFLAPGRTEASDDELITCIKFKTPAKNCRMAFLKFGTRPALDISIASVGLTATIVEDRLRNVKFAFGAVAPTPTRGKKSEEALEGQAISSISEEYLTGLSEIAIGDISPISDVRASAWYRRQLISTLTKRIVKNVISKRD